jgi:type II secretory pathway pseudopilin PulG
MIELIVVVVILGVLAAALVPRMLSNRSREVQADAERAADLLGAAAKRDALTSQRIALEYDGDSATLRMMVMSTGAGDPAAPSLQQWRQDPLTPPVTLTGATLDEALADGAALDRGHWRVEFPQNMARAALCLVFTDERRENPWRVDLPARASRAIVTEGRRVNRGAFEGADSIDLDAAGQGDAAW